MAASARLRDLLADLDNKAGRGDVAVLADEIAKRVYRKVARLMRKQLRELHDPDEEDL